MLSHGMTGSYSNLLINRTYTFNGQLVDEVQDGVTTQLSVLTKHVAADQSTLFLCIAPIPDGHPEAAFFPSSVAIGTRMKLVAIKVNSAETDLRAYEHYYDLELDTGKTALDAISDVTATLDIDNTRNYFEMHSYTGSAWPKASLTNNGSTAYTVSSIEQGATGTPGDNASLTIYLGDTLTLNVDAAGHPLKIQRGGSDRPSSEVSGQGTDVGSVVFTPPYPGTFEYVCSAHPSMTGQIVVLVKTASQLAGYIRMAPSIARGHVRGMYDLQCTVRSTGVMDSRAAAVTKLAPILDLTTPPAELLTSMTKLVNVPPLNDKQVWVSGNYEYTFDAAAGMLKQRKVAEGLTSMNALLWADVTETDGARSLYFDVVGELVDGHSWQARGWFEGMDSLSGGREVLILTQKADNSVLFTKWLYGISRVSDNVAIEAWYDSYTGGLVNGWRGFFTGSGSTYVGTWPGLVDVNDDAQVEAAAIDMFDDMDSGHVMTSTFVSPLV